MTTEQAVEGQIGNATRLSALRDTPTRPLIAAGFVAITGQRIAIPISDTGLSLSTIAVVTLWGYLLLFRRWPVSDVGLIFWMMLMLTGFVSLLANPTGGGTALSLCIFLATYLPLLLLPSKRSVASGAGPLFLRGAFAAIQLGVLIGILQALLQWAGRPFWDPVTSLVPVSLQTKGFNSAYSLQYVQQSFGLSFKPNGGIFLEPSFLSLYASLGLVWLIYQIVTRGPGDPIDHRLIFWSVVMTLGVALSISTSGLPVLAFGLIPLLHRFITNAHVVVIGIGVALLGGSVGAFAPIIAKATEGFDADSSTGLRLRLPYQLLGPFWGESPFIGRGSGSTQSIVDQFSIVGLQVPTVLKAAIEYGLVGCVLLTLSLIVALRGRRAPAALILAGLAAWLIPSEALLNTTLVALLFFVLPHWSANDPAPP